MNRLTIQLKDSDYQNLLKVANTMGKSVNELISEWIAHLPKIGGNYKATKDPIYKMEGYDSQAPVDLSIHSDKYIYGDK
jgi:hypothetical protein